ncbi:MAG: type II toxin-antitoxin system RelE/ParE family toxin [candidate division WOR-3 bacterium]
MYELELLVKGERKEIYALVINGRCEVLEFIAHLDARARKKLDVTLRRIAELGTAGYGQEVVKHLKGNVFEIKEHSSNCRLFCFFHRERLIVCTHMHRKPEGRARYNEEIRKVERLYQECMEAKIL